MSTVRHPERVPGLHLRVARLQQGLAQRDLARELGVSPRRISSLEGAAFVPGNAADRYFRALERLGVGSWVTELRGADGPVVRATAPQPDDSAPSPIPVPDSSPRVTTGP